MLKVEINDKESFSTVTAQINKKLAKTRDSMTVKKYDIIIARIFRSIDETVANFRLGIQTLIGKKLYILI